MELGSLETQHIGYVIGRRAVRYWVRILVLVRTQSVVIAVCLLLFSFGFFACFYLILCFFGGFRVFFLVSIFYSP